ncbi:SGNH hydrolase domain-containing protein [Alteromonas mediterranea]
MLRDFAERNPQLFFVSINEWLCQEKCSPYIDGKVMYFDRSHLNVIQTQSYSGTLMADELEKVLQY